MRALSVLGRTSEAIPEVERALQHSPNDIGTILALGRAYAASDRTEDALSLYARAIDLNPKHPFAWLERGTTLSRLDRGEDAILSFDTALKLDPKLSDAVRSAKADAFIRSDEPEKAIRELRPILKKGALEYGVYATYGWALLKLEKFADAVDYLEKAVMAFPQDQIAMTHLGLSLGGRNKISQSLKVLKKAYEMRKSTRWTALNYGGALLDAKKYDRAVEELPSEIIAHRILHVLINVLNRDLKQGALQTAIKAVEQASSDVRWMQAFSGALIEFLSFASEREGPFNKVQDLEMWRLASQELYEGREQYQMYMAILSVVVDYKRGAGLASLLSLPLEQRRLIVSEAEEQALGRSVNH